MNNNDALIIIDVQNDQFNPDVPESHTALDKIKRLLEHFRSKNLPVIFIKHYNDYPGAANLLRNNSGSDIHPDILPQKGEKIFEKNFVNIMLNRDFALHLRNSGYRNLVFCGFVTNGCVESAVRATADAGYSNILIHDATAAMKLSFNGRIVDSKDVQAAYLATLTWGFAKIVSAGEYLD